MLPHLADVVIENVRRDGERVLIDARVRSAAGAPTVWMLVDAGAQPLSAADG